MIRHTNALPEHLAVRDYGLFQHPVPFTLLNSALDVLTSIYHDVFSLGLWKAGTQLSPTNVFLRAVIAMNTGPGLQTPWSTDSKGGTNVIG